MGVLCGGCYTIYSRLSVIEIGLCRLSINSLIIGFSLTFERSGISDQVLTFSFHMYYRIHAYRSFA